MSSRHHIPFPRTFLSLNTPTKKSTTAPASPVAAAAPEPQQSAHTFLPLRPTVGGRHDSISSVSSVDSVASTASAPADEASAAPVAAQPLPAFLALNAKHAAPPKAARPVRPAESHGFLSNL